jgi:hypothetical protein
MYDFDDSWTTRLLWLTGEFSPLGCLALAFVGGVVVTLAGIGVWNWIR